MCALWGYGIQAPRRRQRGQPQAAPDGILQEDLATDRLLLCQGPAVRREWSGRHQGREGRNRQGSGLGQGGETPCDPGFGTTSHPPRTEFRPGFENSLDPPLTSQSNTPIYRHLVKRIVIAAGVAPVLRIT